MKSEYLEYPISSWIDLHNLVNSLAHGTVTILLKMDSNELQKVGDELPCIRQLRHPPIDVKYNAFSLPPSLTITIKD